jgi:hypothetical protein
MQRSVSVKKEYGREKNHKRKSKKPRMIEKNSCWKRKRRHNTPMTMMWREIYISCQKKMR